MCRICVRSRSNEPNPGGKSHTYLLHLYCNLPFCLKPLVLQRTVNDHLLHFIKDTEAVESHFSLFTSLIPKLEYLQDMGHTQV